MKQVPFSPPGHATQPCLQASRNGPGINVVLLLSLLPMLSAMAAVGDWDPMFGVNGLVEVNGNSGPNLLELADGKVLVVGTPAATNGQASADRRVALNRYLPSGEPDAAYGANGHLTVVLPIPIAGISAIALQHDGKVVMAGTSWATNGTYSFVARVDEVGVLDPTFGSGGVASIPGTEPTYGSVAVLPTGVIAAPISDWTNDRIDRFATDGRSLEDKMRGFIAPARLALQRDGQIIVSGWNRPLKKSGVVRLAMDGTVDTTFGSNGFSALDADYSYSLAVEPGTDRIVLCGPGFVRLTADGHLDPSFGANGTGYVAFGENQVPGFNYCRRLLPMWDGTLAYIGAGEDDAATGVARAFVAGLTSDGNADLRFGAGTGAREIEIGGIGRNWAPYPDYSNALIRTHDGDGLLTWMTVTGLQLARIELDAGTGSDIPPPPISGPTESPPATSTPPPTTPPPPAGDDSGTDRGGGGASGWLDIGWLMMVASWVRSRRFRGFHRFPRTVTDAIGKVGHGSDGTTPSIHNERTMNNMTICSVALGVAVLLGAANIATADAQAIGRTQAAAPLVGTWQVVITPYICLTGQSLPVSFKSRLQFSAGGTMVETPFNPGFQPGQSSSGLGAWGATGVGSYYNVFEAFVNFTGGNYVRGVRRVDQAIEMVDNNHWTSSAIVTFTDEGGNVIPPSGCMTATGERLQ